MGSNERTGFFNLTGQGHQQGPLPRKPEESRTTPANTDPGGQSPGVSPRRQWFWLGLDFSPPLEGLACG